MLTSLGCNRSLRSAEAEKKGTFHTMHSESVGLCHRDSMEAKNINDLIEKLNKLEKNWSSEAIKHNSYDATCGAGRP